MGFGAGSRRRQVSETVGLRFAGTAAKGLRALAAGGRLMARSKYPAIVAKCQPGSQRSSSPDPSQGRGKKDLRNRNWARLQPGRPAGAAEVRLIQRARNSIDRIAVVYYR